ncbi:FxsA family protein [Aliidiomarina quisquiliarum]|uniref:FxsA family protein n=1 Tax=Aliidiomarina quisquiliarum TaxID=2938947 RepID=UPI00208FBFA6|nr:FxsA family protein [Aliidiomarina quisquiliarum]MCO4321171.1 FxsA family protein [Aliidiomarina quisquiliarum]
MYLFILFVLVPIIEISLFIQVGEAIGGLSTIALIILTAFVGAALVRSQGIRTLQSAQLKMAQGLPPGKEMMSGLMLFIAGILFVTPGFFTDGLAILLLLPPVQLAVGTWFIKRLQVRTTHAGFRQEFTHRETGESHVYEAEYEEKKEPLDQIKEQRPEDRER